MGPIESNGKVLIKRKILQTLNIKKSKSENTDNFTVTIKRVQNPLNLTWDSTKLSHFLETVPPDTQTIISGDASVNPNIYANTALQIYSEVQSPEDSGCCDSPFMPATTDTDDSVHDVAVHYHNRILEKHALKVFRTYVLCRKRKHELRLTADQHFRQHKVNQYFRLWLAQIDRMQAERDSGWREACAFERRLLLRRFLHSWHSAIKTLNIPSNELALADNFRKAHSERTLLLTTLSAWHTSLSKHKIAQNWFRTKLLQTVISRWRQYIVCRGERRYLKRVATLHFIERTRQYRFIEWYQLWLASCELRLEYEEAKRYWQLRLLRRCFQSWCHRVVRRKQLTIQVNRLKTEADQSRLRSVLLRWHTHTQRCHRNQTIVTHAIQLRNRSLMRACFSSWAFWTRYQNERRLLIHNQLCSKQQTKSRRLLICWRDWATGQRVQREQTQLAAAVLREKSRALTLHHALNFWRLSLASKRNVELADQQASRRVIRSSFRRWRAFCELQGQKLKMKLAANRFRTITLQVTTVKTWHRNYQESCRIRMLDRLALYHWALCLQARVWTVWRQWVKDRKTKRDLQQTVIRDLQEYRAKKAFAAMIQAAMMIRQERQTQLCHRLWGSNFRTFRLALNAATHWRFWTRRQSTKWIGGTEFSAPLFPIESFAEVAPDTICTMISTSSLTDHSSTEKDEVVEPQVVDERPLGSFELQPCYPEFLLPDLQAQGLAVTNITAYPSTSFTMNKCKVETCEAGTLVNRSVAKFPKKLMNIDRLLDNIDDLYNQILGFRLRKRTLKLWRLRLQVQTDSIYASEENSEQFFEEQNMLHFAEQLQKCRRKCLHGLKKVINITNLYIEAQTHEIS